MRTRFGIYFVAFWFFVAVASLVYPLFDYMATYRSSGIHMPFLVQGIWILTVIVVVAELVGLVLLHPLSRWIYICVISLWTLVIVYILQKDFREQTVSTVQVIWSILFLLINISTLTYLMRPGIRRLWVRQNRKN